jgi:transposase
MWLTGNLQIWLYSQPLDMRKSIDGLSIVVSEQLEKNPCSAEVFVFYNRGLDKLKILYWDKNGFCLWYKRLEKGRFLLPSIKDKSFSLTIEELRWLLDGLRIEELKGNPKLSYETFY